ncbi:MAG TPA: hypothetical protein VF544_02150 [Pyrinomonadaceae bacterium]|jgi:hypothetical protein
MAKKFKTLKGKMTAESRSRIRERVDALLAERRGASVRDLVSEMEASFAAAQERAHAEGEGAPAASDEEIEALVGEAIRRSRRGTGNSSERRASRR